MLSDLAPIPVPPATIDRRAIARWVGLLEEAERSRAPIARLTEAAPALDLELAYLVQTAWVARRARRAGRPIGFKMGLTTAAKQRQMGLSTPIYGILFEGDRIGENAVVARDELVQPKVEPEIAYVIARELRGPGIGLAEATAATGTIHPALEIIDSRYRGFAADLPSMIADNCFSGRFFVGREGLEPSAVDPAAIEVELEKNGEPAGRGTGAAVLGAPAASVALLANLLAAVGEPLPAGSVVLTGGIVPAVPASAGDRIGARFNGFGELSLRFV